MMGLWSKTGAVVLTGLFMLGLAGSPARAGAGATGVYDLGEVVVRAPQQGVEAVGTNREVTAEEIKASGARTLDEALRMLPGLNIRSGPEATPRVDLRGFRSRHVVLLLNGVPFNSTFDGQFDPALIPVDSIARIKVSYGANSVLYGPGGLGGVINIITKAGQPGVGGSVNAEAGQGDRYMGHFNLSGGQDQTQAFVGGTFLNRRAYPLSGDFTASKEQGDGTRANSDRNLGSVLANLQHTPNQSWQLGLSLNAIRGEYGTPASTINNSKDPFADSPKYDRVENQQGFAAQAAAKYQGQGPLSLRSWAYVNQLQQDDKRYDNANYNSMTNPTVQTFDQRSKTTISGLNLQTAYDLKRAGLATLGLIAEKSAWEVDGQSRDVQIGKTKNYAWRTLSGDKSLDQYTAALEYELEVVKNLGLVLGYSHSWQNQDGGGDADDDGFLAGLHYDLATDTRLRGAVAKKVRFPSIRQLYDEVAGSRNLKPEKSYNYEAGIDQKLPGKTKLSLTGFYLDVRDYIEKDDTTNLFSNNQKYRFQGLEFTAQNRYFQRLLLSAGYTLLDTKDLSDGSGKDELQYRPRHKFSLEGLYRFDSGFSAYLGLIHLADQFYYTKKAPLQKEKLGDYSLVNLKLSQSFCKDKWVAYVGADNLLDKDYEEAYGYPQAGRFVYAGLEYRF